ncbi:GGDEF domain-containing protein [Kineosporia babensis]|uniref:GGDEF domain-containing protein n=1 Tax=Kineosporia babensis TaxID=499548 RepID=A0A9X1NB26_9ACTN|nr:GGDEF domain-containing protein [Kineosporia babensis]
MLTLASTVFTMPHMLAAAADDWDTLSVSLVILLVSWTVSYRLARVGIFNDVAEALALIGVMSSLDEPAVAFGFVFPMIWFRSLYGSNLQVAVRIVLYEISLILEVPASHLLGQPDDPHAWAFLLGGMTGYVASGLAGRWVGAESIGRDLSVGRERMVAEKGTALLGLTDPAAIREIAWSAHAEIVRSSKDLRIVKLDMRGEGLVLDRTLGTFAAEVGPMTLADIGVDPSEGLDHEDGVIGPLAIPLLDRAVGRACTWMVLRFSNYGFVAYIVLGHPQRLEPELLSAVRSVCNQTALAMQNSRVHSQLSEQALTDGLTGLANRAGFTEAVHQMSARREDQSLAVLFVDLDDFKEVNDTLGHKAGDELLLQVANLLRSVTRAQVDVVARLGGDEFAVLLHNTPLEIAEQVAERIVLGVSVLEVTNGLEVGASIGVAMASAKVRIEDLLVHADVAMYAAKAHGKGRIQAYHPGLLKRPEPD